ncbi:hypothetical protein GCM10011352_25760 [Marinobacterium zhoushanense]|uniref:Photosynthesis system II assembly factor Ycf48/Hcf136-like domain-containing protein n=1 Tax=Marinobacterium zhoushanense TaxID=1679163 RepID=A0ABQ1KFF4_9GAMM|nr:hypothetical protein GCM10011352_25760 [Marinobacterium zhoushanense]
MTGFGTSSVLTTSVLTRVLPVCAALLLGAPIWSATALAATGYSGLDKPAQISPLALHKSMLAVARASERLVAVGEEGTVLLSDDNGVSWRQAQQVPTSAALTAVQFVDADKGWAVGHLGVVLTTDDGGQSWRKQLDGIQAAQLALEHARARGDESALSSAQYLVDDGPDKPFLNLFFLNERTGFVFGAYNLIFRTDDGGDSWTPWLDRVENPMGMHLYGMAQSDGVLMLAGEQGSLVRSSDGGQHFDAIDSPYEGSYFGIIAEADGAFVAYGLRGNAFRSEDGGESWVALDTGQGETLTAATNLSDGRLLLTSQAGGVLVDRDGQPFTRLPDLPPLPLSGVVQAADGAPVVTSLAGVHRFDAVEE